MYKNDFIRKFLTPLDKEFHHPVLCRSTVYLVTQQCSVCVCVGKSVSHMTVLLQHVGIRLKAFLASERQQTLYLLHTVSHYQRIIIFIFWISTGSDHTTISRNEVVVNLRQHEPSEGAYFEGNNTFICIKRKKKSGLFGHTLHTAVLDIAHR